MDVMCKFHYLDKDGKDVVPEMATRITLLVYDEFCRISKRVDWKRDDVNIYDDCSSLLETNEEKMRSLTDVLESMRNTITNFKNAMRNYNEDTLNYMK